MLLLAAAVLAPVAAIAALAGGAGVPLLDVRKGAGAAGVTAGELGLGGAGMRPIHEPTNGSHGTPTPDRLEWASPRRTD